MGWLDKSVSVGYMREITSTRLYMGDNMIKIGDMVGFEFKGDYHLAIVIDDLGQDYPYGRYTGLLIGSDGDYVPLNEEELKVLETEQQVDQWERQKKVAELMKRGKNDLRNTRH
jgi:hypothetical protein